MLLAVRDDMFRYRIEAPDKCEVKIGHGGFDYLLVPNPLEPGQQLWLFDDILIEMARSGELGLSLLSEVRL